MQIATWNINGIKSRLELLKTWLSNNKFDIICLQETKSTDDTFPKEELESLGYNVSVHGQKSFNGVAILSRNVIEVERKKLPNEPPLPPTQLKRGPQARYLEAITYVTHMQVKIPIRVASVYLPNGNPYPGERFDFKLKWMDALNDHCTTLLSYEDYSFLGGDFNIISTTKDCVKPDDWQDDAVFRPEARKKFKKLQYSGFSDSIRMLTSKSGVFSYWGYRSQAWQKNNGIRIDYLMLSPLLANYLQSSSIQKHIRGKEKTSDHAPVIATFKPITK